MKHLWANETRAHQKKKETTKRYRYTWGFGVPELVSVRFVFLFLPSLYLYLCIYVSVYLCGGCKSKWDLWLLVYLLLLLLRFLTPTSIDTYVSVSGNLYLSLSLFLALFLACIFLSFYKQMEEIFVPTERQRKSILQKLLGHLAFFTRHQ